MMDMKLKDYLQKHLQDNQGTGPKSDVVITSRVRLARNIKDKIFPWRANTSVLEQIWDEVKEKTSAKNMFPDGNDFLLGAITPLDRQLLIERHTISFNHASSDWPRGVIISSNSALSIMVNEEDHLRMSAIMPGLSLHECARSVDDLDNNLSREMEFSFSEQWGFLTSCPTNAGTGMRASCLVHLPALTLRDKIEPLLSELSKLGIVVRGFYGEGTKVIGDIYQITNGTTLGHTENEILTNIEHVVNGIISYEKAARKELNDSRLKHSFEDRVFRASAVLTSARKINFQEAMEMISMVRLGISMGMDLHWPEEAMNQLIVMIQPAHLQEILGKELAAEERDFIRAKLIRQKLEEKPAA